MASIDGSQEASEPELLARAFWSALEQSAHDDDVRKHAIAGLTRLASHGVR